MKDKDFFDLRCTVINELKIEEVSADPCATQNTVYAVIKILDNMGVLNWPLSKVVKNPCNCKIGDVACNKSKFCGNCGGLI